MQAKPEMSPHAASCRADVVEQLAVAHLRERGADPAAGDASGDRGDERQVPPLLERWRRDHRRAVDRIAEAPRVQLDDRR